MNKVRTVMIDGIAIRTSLSAVEIANLPKVNAELKKENERLKEQYCERTDCSGRLGNSKKVEELIKENEKLNHYKLLYQKVKDRNEKAIEYLHETCNIGLGELSVYGDDINPCELKKILEGNNEE